jgi:histone H3
VCVFFLSVCTKQVATNCKAPRKSLTSRSATGGAVEGSSSRSWGSKSVPGDLARFAIMSAPAGGVKPNPPQKHKYRPGTVSLSQIRHYQRTTDLLMQKTVFARWVRELLDESEPGTRLHSATVECLQEAIEYYLVKWFEDMNSVAIHCKRVTIMPKDSIQIQRLRQRFEK